MTARDKSLTGQLMETVRELTRRVEQQEAQIQSQGAELRRLQAQRAEPSAAGGELVAGPRRLSRKGLFTVAATGAVAAAVAGLDPSLNSGTALASNGDTVKAGEETKAEGGTLITYDGSPGLKGAVLIGNDSTYGAGPYNYPAAVAGLAGGGSTAGPGGVVNGVYAFTDNGAGNGLVGYNSNKKDGSGTGVLGLAFRRGSYGVQGINTIGDGVSGITHVQDGIGVVGTNDAQGGTAVAGMATAPNGGIGGYFSGAFIGVYGQGDRGVNAQGVSTGVFAVATGANGSGLFADGDTAIFAIGTTKGIYGVTQSTAANAFAIHGELSSTKAASGSAAVRGQNDGAAPGGVGVWGSHAGAGIGGMFTSESGAGTGVLGQALSPSGTGNAVQGQAFGLGAGVRADSAFGCGAILSGKSAQLQLIPSSSSNHPSTGSAGDLFLDKARRLWLCKGGKVWKRLA